MDLGAVHAGMRLRRLALRSDKRAAGWDGAGQSDSGFCPVAGVTVYPARACRHLVAEEALPVIEGCDACSRTGRKGRQVVTELLTMSGRIEDAVAAGIRSEPLKDLADREVFSDLSEERHMLVERQIIDRGDFESVLRVLIIREGARHLP